jgi:hypothetical protein
MAINSESRKVSIIGGTFALCFWLAVIAQQACEIDQKLGRISASLDRIAPQPPAEAK